MFTITESEKRCRYVLFHSDYDRSISTSQVEGFVGPSSNSSSFQYPSPPTNISTRWAETDYVQLGFDVKRANAAQQTLDANKMKNGMVCKCMRVLHVIALMLDLILPPGR